MRSLGGVYRATSFVARGFILCSALALVTSSSGCLRSCPGCTSKKTPTPTPTATSTGPTPSPTPTQTATPIATPTQTATPTTAPTPSHTPTPTQTATPPATPTQTATPTPTPATAANACLPSASVSVLVQGTNATCYVATGRWTMGTPIGVTGVSVVPIETSAGIGTGARPLSIATANTVNSCASSSTTGQTVCVANNSDVYLIAGSTLQSTLQSSAMGFQFFSGGLCENCGVVIDSSVNKALISIAVATGGPGGYQFLDLGATPVFETPTSAGANTSEGVSIDPTRHFVLSPNEQGNYQILDTSASPPGLFNNNVTGTPMFDSAAEDCTTGIALATREFTDTLFIADLTQATFTQGMPGTWTDTASQLQAFPEFSSFSSGTSGVAVAPGTHLAVVTGEFGGNVEGVIQLPASSGNGIPAVVDWVAFTMPNDPSGAPWADGFDPHTVTAYVSPNSGKAFGVMGNGSTTFLAIVDLQGLLSAPRTGHVVNSPLPPGVVTFVAE